MKNKQKKKRAFNVFSYLYRYGKIAIFIPILKGIEALIEIFNPKIMANIIDIGIKNNDTAYIWKFSVLILCLSVVSLIIALISQKCSAISCENMAKHIRSDIYSHVCSYSYSELDDFTTTGLLNRSLHDVQHIKGGTGMLLRTFIRIPFVLIGSLVMALSINLKLSIVFAVVCPLLLLVVLLIMKKLTPLLESSKQKLDNTSNVTRENLTGVRVVRAFNKQNFEAERFQKSNYDLINTQLKLGAWSAVLIPIIQLIINFAIIVILYFGGFEVNIGGISQGNLIAFINYFTTISSGMFTIARMITVWSRIKASANRIDEVLSLQNTIVNPTKPVVVDYNDPNLSAIEFRNVIFSYNNSKYAVNGLNLKIEPGQTIGIIGGTGSGKSSVTNLVARFYDTTKGQVLIGGKNIKNYDIADIRKIVSIVPQNPTLFTGTIKSNLVWRNPSADDKELIKALKISQSYDFVAEYPDFLNHKVTKGGTNFSGGQKQRLTIARALVGSPKILILDDSSSALDFATDAKLRKSIKQNLKNTTTIIVSQRTNSIKDCDNIVVMDAGNIIDIGKHNELLNRCALYQEIHFSQNSKEGE